MSTDNDMYENLSTDNDIVQNLCRPITTCARLVDMSGCRELSTPSLGEYISPDNYSEGGLIVRGPYSPGAHSPHQSR
eukprot:3973135-Pyramimonas_sp.AAC.1